MSAFNGWSRARWFRRVAAEIAERVGAKAPDWVHDQPVYLVTLADEGDLIGDYGHRFELDLEALWRTRHKFKAMLEGLDYFGMIDVASVVSAMSALGVPRAMMVHGHFVVWGISDDNIKTVCRSINATVSAALPYAKAAHRKRVKDGHLLQVIWYANKMPYKQYQLGAGQRVKPQTIQARHQRT